MIKVKKSTAYWAAGISLLIVVALFLNKPHLWYKLESLGQSGYVVASNKYDSWVSRPNGNVIMVADASMARSYAPQRSQPAVRKKPSCLRWHRVKRGQTQWFLAQAYNNRKNKQEWLRGMRWLSGKRTNDDSLQIGESVCVSWTRSA